MGARQLLLELASLEQTADDCAQDCSIDATVVRAIGELGAELHPYGCEQPPAVAVLVKTGGQATQEGLGLGLEPRRAYERRDLGQHLAELGAELVTLLTPLVLGSCAVSFVLRVVLGQSLVALGAIPFFAGEVALTLCDSCLLDSALGLGEPVIEHPGLIGQQSAIGGGRQEAARGAALTWRAVRAVCLGCCVS